MKQLKHKFKQKDLRNYKVNIEVRLGSSNGSQSYLDVFITECFSGPFSYLLGRVWDAWCLENGILIDRINYGEVPFFLHSTRETASFTKLNRAYDYDSKFKVINWLINQTHLIGIDYFSTGRVLNKTEFQIAIWTLLGQPSEPFVPSVNNSYLVSEALSKGAEFVANSKQLQGLLIIEKERALQPLIISVKACEILGSTEKAIRLFRKIKSGKSLLIENNEKGTVSFSGLTAGFKYFLKKRESRKSLSEFVLEPGAILLV